MRLEIVNNEIEITKEEEVLPYEVSENIRYKNSISSVDIFSRGFCEITLSSLFLFGRNDINVFRGMEIGEKITIQNNKNIDLNTPDWREAIGWFNNKYGVKKMDEENMETRYCPMCSNRHKVPVGSFLPQDIFTCLHCGHVCSFRDTLTEEQYSQKRKESIVSIKKMDEPKDEELNKYSEVFIGKLTNPNSTGSQNLFIKKDQKIIPNINGVFKINQSGYDGHPGIPHPKDRAIKTSETLLINGIEITARYKVDGAENPFVCVLGGNYFDVQDITDEIKDFNNKICALSFAREKLKEMIGEKK